MLDSTKASQYKIPIAVSAYKENRAPKLLLSGSKVKDFNEGRMSEADHMCRTAIMLDVKEEDIVLETISQNTIENILGSSLELQHEFCINHVKMVLLVTTS